MPGISYENIAVDTISRVNMNTDVTGRAVITKVIAGTGISLSSSGTDAGTGDVTISVSGLPESSVTNLVTDLAAKAALAGANFTGNVFAPNLEYGKEILWTTPTSATGWYSLFKAATHSAGQLEVYAGNDEWAVGIGGSAVNGNASLTLIRKIHVTGVIPFTAVRVVGDGSFVWVDVFLNATASVSATIKYFGQDVSFVTVLTPALSTETILWQKLLDFTTFTGVVPLATTDGVVSSGTNALQGLTSLNGSAKVNQIAAPSAPTLGSQGSGAATVSYRLSGLDPNSQETTASSALSVTSAAADMSAGGASNTILVTPIPGCSLRVYRIINGGTERLIATLPYGQASYTDNTVPTAGSAVSPTGTNLTGGLTVAGATTLTGATTATSALTTNGGIVLGATTSTVPPLKFTTGGTIPSSPSEGMLWFDPTTHFLQYRDNNSRTINLSNLHENPLITTVRIGQPPPGGGDISGVIPCPGTTRSYTLKRVRFTASGPSTTASFTFNVEIHNTGNAVFAAALTSTITVTDNNFDVNITSATSGTAFGSMVMSNNSSLSRWRFNATSVPVDLTGLVLEAEWG